MLRRLVNADVKWAVHRLDAEFLLFKLHRRKHRVGVVDLVAAREPELALGDVRPEDESLAVVFLDRKQIQLTTKTAMVTLFGFFTLLEPRVELFLREERRTVN